MNIGNSLIMTNSIIQLSDMILINLFLSLTPISSISNPLQVKLEWASILMELQKESWKNLERIREESWKNLGRILLEYQSFLLILAMEPGREVGKRGTIHQWTGSSSPSCWDSCKRIALNPRRMFRDPCSHLLRSLPNLSVNHLSINNQLIYSSKDRSKWIIK